MEGRSRDDCLERLDGQIQPADQQERLLRALRLQHRICGGAAPEAVRRQSDPREYHEARLQSGYGAAAAVARNSAEDHADRPASDQADAAGALRRIALRAVQRRAGERLTPLAKVWKAPALFDAFDG